jgi:adenylate cyclase
VDILKHWIQDQDGRVFGLQTPFSIGRSPDNRYVIATERVSRRHALVQARSEGEFWLTDLGSRNGVFLNRQPLQQAVLLKAGDVFQVADCQFVYHRQELEEVTPSGIPGDVTLVDRNTVNSWIVIADIVGSVRQAQAHAPDEWTARVGAWLGECRELLGQSGGAMNKFLGDGFLGFWRDDGVPGAQIAAALQALLARQARAALSFRFVVHHGPVHFISMAPGEISLTGNAVNLAFRLEKVASSLGQAAVATRPAIDACGNPPDWISLGTHSIPSFSEPVELFAPVDPSTA